MPAPHAPAYSPEYRAFKSIIAGWPDASKKRLRKMISDGKKARLAILARHERVAAGKTLDAMQQTLTHIKGGPKPAATYRSA